MEFLREFPKEFFEEFSENSMKQLCEQSQIAFIKYFQNNRKGIFEGG